ncbi:hypothetical protein [Vitiosangium sp. GDMCC 1.1324]|uniref:hypothetical protein n=1 Tax=Vitiosangium sp. (strain GDMCC 1.1324) TaxID=2138576 RepID=UPI0011B77575|nr:hypothetical protein [Vitiosangium sp. GDMCC 1.1324]
MKDRLVFVAGLSAGLMGTLVVAGIASYKVVKFEEQRLQHGWRLVPVVVAPRALAAGTRMTFAEMAQRPMPEQLVTSSVVKPDSATYVVDQVLTVPLSDGDRLHWTFFSRTRNGLMRGPEPSSPRDPDLWEACDAALAASSTTARRERTPADIRARLVSEVRP